MYHFLCLLAIARHNGVNNAKKCWKKQTFYRILKKVFPLLVVLFLGRAWFYIGLFKIYFRSVAVKKFIISGVYWQYRHNGANNAKKCSKKQTVYRILKKYYPSW